MPQVDPARPVEGLRVLVVEDEALISLLVEDMLLDLGSAEVWVAGNLQAAFRQLQAHRPDLAVLDVNLAGELCFPFAAALHEAGIPFLFATGYGIEGVPAAWRHRPVIQKPFQMAALSRVLRTLAESRAA